MFKRKQLIISLILLLSVFAMFDVRSFADTLKEAEAKIVKVQVIYINPEITYGGGKKTTAAAATGFVPDESVIFMKDNLELGANGAVEYIVNGRVFTLNEFPKFRTQKSLTEAEFKEAYCISEETGVGSWWAGVDSPICKKIKDFGDLDYDYIVDKFDLVNRKNNNEFDMVWIFGPDPLSPYETCMVGSKAFWVNGMPVTRKCENFVIATMTYARKDGSIENIGHMCEDILNNVFKVDHIYDENTIDGSDLSKLNSWQKFILCKRNATPNTKVYGVGDVHFSPNSLEDYDWKNETSVKSYWRDYLMVGSKGPDYPGTNVGTFTYTDSYKDLPVLHMDIIGPAVEESVTHHVWWYQLMPHYEGRDSRGYLNNWWEYLTTYDYTTAIQPVDFTKSSKPVITDNTITMKTGESYSLAFRRKSYAGKNELMLTNRMDNPPVISVSNNSVLSVDKAGNLQALKTGTSVVTLKYDGYNIAYNIKVLQSDIVLKKPSITKVKTSSKALTISCKSKDKNIKGYEIQVATNKSFKKNLKKFTVKKKTVSSKKLTKLKAKTKYYIRVRTYTTQKVNGKTQKVYSKWTVSKKTYKTK